MDKIRVRGGRPLFGEATISGAKNSTLPCMAASLMTPEPVLLHNAPRQVRDVATMKLLLEHLGTAASWEENSLRLQADGCTMLKHEPRFPTSPRTGEKIG